METVNLYMIMALITGVVFPVYAIYEGRKLRQFLSEEPNKKIQVLKVTGIQLIVLMILCLLPFWVDHSNLNVIGLGFITNPFWIIGLFVCSFLGWWLFKKLKMTQEAAQKLFVQNSRIQFLLPTNDKEYKLMILVSFIAGICEEIIYRGFLLWFLSNYMPLIPSIILANLPFALAHLTSTGIKNSMQAFILALVFTGAYLLTQSLWLPILLHILMDLYATILSYKSSQMVDLKNLSNPSP